jgi:hypothetical protein
MPCAMGRIWVRTCERRKRLNPSAIRGESGCHGARARPASRSRACFRSERERSVTIYGVAWPYGGGQGSAVAANGRCKHSDRDKSRPKRRCTKLRCLLLSLQQRRSDQCVQLKRSH